jgi:hypothetical protein
LGVDENGSCNGFPITPNKLFMQEVLILMPLLTFYLLGMSNFCLTNLFVFVSFFNIVYRSSKKVFFFFCFCVCLDLHFFFWVGDVLVNLFMFERVEPLGLALI